MASDTALTALRPLRRAQRLGRRNKSRPARYCGQQWLAVLPHCRKCVTMILAGDVCPNPLLPRTLPGLFLCLEHCRSRLPP